MFQIDLKTASARRPRLEERASRVSQTTASLAAPALVLVTLLAGLWIVNRELDGSIAAGRARVSSLEAAVDASRKELAEVSGRRRVLYATQRKETYWSDELRMLSEKLPDKMWLTQVKVTSSGGGEKGAPVTRNLFVEGGVLSNPSEGNLDLIGKFIQDLQADRRFEESFSAVTLESVKRAGDPYTLNFQLRIGFKTT
jgi:hypothetical protein